MNLDALLSAVPTILLAACAAPFAGFCCLIFQVWNKSRLGQGTCIAPRKR